MSFKLEKKVIKILICEIFYAIQGEGTYVGKPTIFIRTSGCNMKPACSWCDSKYHIKGKEMNFEQILSYIKPISNKTECMEICITGGEPTIQKDLDKLISLLGELKYNVSIETNGLNKLSGVICGCYIVCSPKWKKDKFLIHNNNVSLVDCIKVVVKDENQVLNAIAQFGKKHLQLMPLGATRKELIKNSTKVIEWCKKYNLQFSPRLHIYIYDNKRGV